MSAPISKLTGLLPYGEGGRLAARRPGLAGKALGHATELSPASCLHPVGQDHVRHLVDLGNTDFRDATVGGQGLRRFAADQVSAMAADPEADVQLRERSADDGW